MTHQNTLLTQTQKCPISFEDGQPRKINKFYMRNRLALIIPLMFIAACNTGLINREIKSERNEMNIIPKPAEAFTSEGRFYLTDKTLLLYNQKNTQLHDVAAYFTDRIKLTSGYELEFSEREQDSGNPLIFLNIDDIGKEFGDEGYFLDITTRWIHLTANTSTGIFYGIQSLLQLLPPQVFNDTMIDRVSWSVPCIKIKDKPSYSWRGMHLDVCRHFYPKEFIKRYIDLLALHKMNTFHWHLTEDQGWRIEIKKYPKLTDIGAWRVDRSGITWNDRKSQQPGETANYGGYYTQDDIREIVEYAEKRFITIVPEIELPGHALAALAGYPEYSCTGGPFHVATGGYWPIVDVYCPGNDDTFLFLEDILGEVIDLFPGDYIHIGGDEVHKANWKKCPKCQRRISTEGLKDEDELQSYFIKRIENYLTSQGKKLVGWDEILEGGLAPEATVMSWRGMKGGIEAATQGHDVVMSPTSHCYFDYYQGEKDDEPEAIGGYLPLEKVYKFDPTPPELSLEESKHILGGQGNVWTEYMPTSKHVEYMTFPRMTALAEAVWSPAMGRNYEDFIKRLSVHLIRLDKMGVHYRPIDK